MEHDAKAGAGMELDAGKMRAMLDTVARTIHCSVPLASEYVQRAADGGRLGFKRGNVRC